MKKVQFADLFQEGLADIYDAEKQIIAALPKMIAASSSMDLSGALEAHLEDTKEQVTRLETIFEQIGEQPGGHDCRPMAALLSEGERLIDEFDKSPILDTALIAAAQKVEHYEIVTYRHLCTMAELLGQQETFDLLETTLAEEIEADETLTEVSETALEGGEDDDLEDEEDEDEELEEEEEEEAGSGGRRQPSSLR